MVFWHFDSRLSVIFVVTHCCIQIINTPSSFHAVVAIYINAIASPPVWSPPLVLLPSPQWKAVEPTSRQLHCCGEDDIIGGTTRCTNWEITKGKCFSLSRRIITDLFGNCDTVLVASLSTLSTSSRTSFRSVSIANDDFELNAAFVPGLGCTVLYSFVSVAAPPSVHLLMQKWTALLWRRRPMEMNSQATRKRYYCLSLMFFTFLFVYRYNIN